MAGTILYIDDAPDLPEGLARELGRLGFRLQYSVDCDEAHGLAHEGRVRLLLIEPLLEDGRGWDLIHSVRGLPKPLCDVPIVVLTRGQRTPTLYGHAVELGVDDFLARPVMRAEIIAAILECMALDQAGSDPDPFRVDADRLGESGANGNLADFPLPELLIRLRDEGATGVVRLQEFEGLAVQLRNGSPIGVASSRGNEGFADFLMRTKRISDQEHEALLERVHETGESEPMAAAAIGALSRSEVRSALADRVSEPLLEAFGWSEGSFRFEPDKRIRSSQALEGDVTGLLVRGVLQWTPARTIRAMLDRRGALYLSRNDRAPCSLHDLPALRCDSGLLDGFDGDQTIAQVLESGAIDEADLYAMLVAALVEARPEPVLELDRVVEDRATETAEASGPILELDQPVEPTSPASTGTTRAVTAEQTGTGVRDAAVAALDDTEATAEQIAERIAERIDERIDEPSEAERARDAEWHFMEGERHLDRKQYDQAMASFGMCAHLDPDQGEYRAHLGYAMHLQNPRDETVRREALEHIAKGVKLAPERWRPMLYLARVFIAADDVANARKVLATAARKHPECEPIKAELRKLVSGLAREKVAAKAGVIGRLRGWWKG